MVVSTPQQAEVKLNNIVGKIQEVPNLPPRLLVKARELLQRGYGLLNLTEEQIDHRLDVLRINDNNVVNMDNIKAEIDRCTKSVLPKLELAHIFQELFEMLYNAKHSPEERDPYDALHWYHNQIQEAMGGDDQRGFVSGENLKQRKHEIPRMLAVVVDTKNNNRVYFGMPTENKEVPNQHRLDNAYPRFKTLINECSNGRPNVSRPLTNCAEFEAYDKALWEREENNSNSRQLFEGLEVIPAFGRSKIFGKVLDPCNNCQYLYAMRT